MEKYPKREENASNYDFGRTRIHPGLLFREGSAQMHAPYLIEMKARHPIMYWLWYRWWIPSLLHPDERKLLDNNLRNYREYKMRPFWADFALYHPVQFLVYVFLMYTMKFPTKVYKQFSSATKRS